MKRGALMQKIEVLKLSRIKRYVANPRLFKWARAIERSGLFDVDWYRTSYADVKSSGMSPVVHYVLYGAQEGRDPSQSFSTLGYVAANPDVAESGVNPFYHYIRFGLNEGRVLGPVADGSSMERVGVRLGSVQLLSETAHGQHRVAPSAPALAAAKGADGGRAAIGALRDGYLYGWVRMQPVGRPVLIDVFVDGAPVAQRVSANLPRPDLGAGCVGFRIDLSVCPLQPHGELSIRDSEAGDVLCSKSVKKIIPKYVGKNYRSKIDYIISDFDSHSALLGVFDESYYLMNNPDVARVGVSALRHYLAYGFKELRNPGSSFDVVWYTQAYLNSDWSQDALFHYATSGRLKGNLTRPRLPVRFNPPVSYKRRKRTPRRVCLFAGYDPDGVIDSVVIEFIAELSRFSDVYYLADCAMPQSELDKLRGITKGAWASRHGRYDFGSWSLLAKELVGWHVVDGYDELILANDSSYLMRSFDAVFEKMDACDCDWWGLQATKGISATFATQRLPGALSIEEIKRNWLDRFENDQVYDFLLGSYFLNFRKNVINNKKFRKLLENVSKEDRKYSIIRKYEIGITRLLISEGFEFSTYVDFVYERQPVYSERSFEMVRDGFPLFKKYHLIHNHYRIDALWDWPRRLQDAGIDKGLEPYVENLQRTGDARKIYRSMDVAVFDMDPPMTQSELLAEDLVTPKYDDWWCFPVCAYSHRFNDNIRALFEEVKNDRTIKKIVLTQSKHVAVDGENVVVAPLASREGQYYLLRSRHIFLKHGVRANLGGVSLSHELHAYHNLWHGIPLKRIGFASIDQQGGLDDLAEQNGLLRSVICASKVDQLAMTAAYWPLKINDIWLTGLPRHDLIVKEEAHLPRDMQEQLGRLRQELNGRKLILFAPTFRNDQDEGYYSFSKKEKSELINILQKNGFVLGIREHMADRSRQYSSQLVGNCFISVSEGVYPNVEVLMREASALVTDYSSIFIDFLVTGRPVISFAYDYEKYSSKERGLFYDLEWCFPGAIATDFQSLAGALLNAMKGHDASAQERYEHRRRLFIEKLDGQNSSRVVDRVKALKMGDLTVFDIDEAQGASVPRHVLWVYDAGHEITARYRIFNLVPELNEVGWSAKIVTSQEVTLKDAALAGVVVFSRVAATDQIMDIVEALQRRNVKVVFDIDDFMFEPDELMQAEYYRDRPERRAATRRTVYGYRRLIKSVDLVTVSTSALKERVERLAANAAVIPNSVGMGLVEHYSNERTMSSGDVVKICYLSGTQTHSRDFSLIREAVCNIQEEFGNVEFHIVGSVAYDSEVDDQLLSGWIRHPRMGYEQMHAFLEGMDINVAPLSQNVFNDCKSELKIFEAALHKVPTIASPTASYAGCLEHGVNGFLAEDSLDWEDCLRKLISSEATRNAMGQEAYRLLENEFTARRAAELYVARVLER